MVQKQTTSLDALAAVAAVARHGSARRAAEALGVSHTTLARQVAAAERALGIVAFVRGPGGYAPTEAGRLVLEHAERIAEEADHLARALAGLDEKPRGRVGVSMPAAVLTLCIAPVFAEFVARWPGIALDIDTRGRFLDLDRNETEVAVRLAAEPPPDLVGVRVATVYEAAYIAAGADAASASLVAFSLGEPFRARAAALGFGDRAIAAVCADVSGQAALAAGGAGVAILPCIVGDSDPRLERAPPGTTLPAQPVWVLTHPDLRRSARVRAVTAFLSESLRASADLFEGRREGTYRRAR